MHGAKIGDGWKLDVVGWMVDLFLIARGLNPWL